MLPSTKPGRFKYFVFGIIICTMVGCAQKGRMVDFLNPDQNRFVCRGEVSLTVKSPEESFRVDALIDFAHASDHSKLKLQILSPLRTTLAQVNVTGNKGIWRDQKGSIQIDEHPTGRRWLRGQWWTSLGIVFNQPASSPVEVDRAGDIISAKIDSATIECSNQPTRDCKLNQNDLFLRFVFTSLDCRNSL